jgi:hypothetical protein
MNPAWHANLPGLCSSMSHVTDSHRTMEGRQMLSIDASATPKDFD